MDLTISIPLTDTRSIALGLPTILLIILFGLTFLMSVCGAVYDMRAKTIESRYRLAKRGLAAHRVMTTLYGLVAILSIIGFCWLAAAMALSLVAMHWFHTWKIKTGDSLFQLRNRSF